jgi:hypothetical protein
MIIDNKKVVILYLEDWQQRMVKDFLGVDTDTWEVPIGGEIIPMYMARLPDKAVYKKMYFTDWQMRELRDEAGITCDFIELKKEIPISMYKVFTPDNPKV